MGKQVITQISLKSVPTDTVQELSVQVLWTFNLRTACRGYLSVKTTEHNVFQNFQGHNCEAQLQTEQRRSIRIQVKSRAETYSKPT